MSNQNIKSIINIISSHCRGIIYYDASKHFIHYKLSLCIGTMNTKYDEQFNKLNKKMCLKFTLLSISINYEEPLKHFIDVSCFIRWLHYHK